MHEFEECVTSTIEGRDAIVPSVSVGMVSIQQYTVNSTDDWTSERERRRMGCKVR